MAGEILGHRLASIHNLRLLVRLVGQVREAIGDGLFFFVNKTATTEMYTAQYTFSLHDALPIFGEHDGHTLRRSGRNRKRFQQLRLGEEILDRKSTRLNSSHIEPSRMPSSA